MLQQWKNAIKCEAFFGSHSGSYWQLFGLDWFGTRMKLKFKSGSDLDRSKPGSDKIWLM